MVTTETSQTALETMIERFRSVLVNSPQNPTVLLGFAEANLRRGRRLEALQAYQKVLSLTPDVSDAHMAVAEIYLLHGLPLEAYDELRKVFELEPGRPEAHLLLHEIEPLAPVPHELERLRLRFPTELQIAETHSRLVLEIEHLVREVEQLRELGEGPTSEPVHAYHLEQARKRLSRTQHLLGLLDSLPTGEAPVPRAEPVAPEVVAEEEPGMTLLPMDFEPEPASDLDSEPEPEYAERPMPDLDQEFELPAQDEEAPQHSAYDTVEMPSEKSVDEMTLEELLAGTEGLDLGESEPTGDGADIENFFSSLAITEPEPMESQPYEDMAPAVEEEELAPEPQPEPEEEPEPEPVAGSAGPSAARLAFYDSIAGGLRDAVDDLLRTRGLTSIFVVSVDGHVVAHQSRDSITAEQMGQLVVQIQQCLREYSGDLAYWALECEGGIILLQQLDERHGLVAVGQAGASFAMIRLNLDKARPKLADPLVGAPHD